MRLANKSDKEAILNFWTVCFGADMRYQNILTATDYPLKTPMCWKTARKSCPL